MILSEYLKLIDIEVPEGTVVWRTDAPVPMTVLKVTELGVIVAQQEEMISPMKLYIEADVKLLPDNEEEVAFERFLGENSSHYWNDMKKAFMAGIKYGRENK